MARGARARECAWTHGAHVVRVAPRHGRRVIAAAVVIAAALDLRAVLLAQTPAGPAFGATLVVDRAAIRIGERLGATLTLEGADRIAAARPAIGQRVGEFEVLAITPAGIARLFGRAPRAWRLELTTFETGARTLEGLAVEGTTPDGRAFLSSSAPPVSMTVTAPQVSADDPLQPADPALSVPPPPAALVWGGRGLAALGVTLLALAIGRPAWTRLRVRLERTRRWRRLHRTLDGLRSPDDAEAARSQCDTVAAVLREGSQYAAAKRLVDLSTTELVQAMTTTDAGRAVAPELAPVLTDLDGWRFAGRAPAAADVAQAIERARHVLTVAEAATRAEERRAS